MRTSQFSRGATVFLALCEFRVSQQRYGLWLLITGEFGNALDAGFSKGRSDFPMEVGDTVLHPRYGVGVIGGIETRVQDGEKREYYVIPKPSISSTIFVPVDSADEVGLRPISPPEKLQQALKILSGEDEYAGSSGNIRTLSWSDPLDLARAIRRQALEPKSRYPKVSEQHQLKRAKKLLIEEVAVVLGMSEEAVSALIDGAAKTAQDRAASDT